jgi:hypothetical protein
MQGVVQLTTSEKPAHLPEGVTTRTVIGWVDDDDPVASEHIIGGLGGLLPEVVSVSDSFGSMANDVAQNVFSQLTALRPPDVSGIASRVRDHLVHYSAELSAIPSMFANHMLKTVAGTLNIGAGTSPDEHTYKLAGGAVRSEGGAVPGKDVVRNVLLSETWLLDAGHGSKMMVEAPISGEVGLSGFEPPFITAAGAVGGPQAGVSWVNVPSTFESREAMLEISGRRDFHSIAMPDLADIELTIGSVNNALREFAGRYVREHGTAYSDVDEFGSTELTYTDALGDLPPLSREYDDVDVVIVGEDELKPRTYTNEDHQVWRT